MSTPDQQRATHAWNAVQEALKDKSGFPKYLGAARKLPVRIMASGLGQAIVFLRAKAPKTPAFRVLIQHITDWVLNQPVSGNITSPLPDDYKLVKRIIGVPPETSTADDLRRYTADILAYLQWLNRFCEATGVKEEEVNE